MESRFSLNLSRHRLYPKMSWPVKVPFCGIFPVLLSPCLLQLLIIPHFKTHWRIFLLRLARKVSRGLQLGRTKRAVLPLKGESIITFDCFSETDIRVSRDTVDSALITSMLMTILEANGTRHYPPILKKRIRDDVCWATGERPWRRSPFWLVLRVAVQRHLCTLFGGDVGKSTPLRLRIALLPFHKQLS